MKSGIFKLSVAQYPTEAVRAPADVVELAEQRQAARAAKDFAESDRLRDAIAAAGWEVRDVAGGFQLVPK